MTIFRLEGQYLGHNDPKPYDFPDAEDKTRRVTGTSYSVNILQDVEVVRVGVKADDLPQFEALERNDELDMLVDVRAASGARSAYLRTTFSEMIAAPARGLKNAV